MVGTVTPDVCLDPLQGPARPIGEWVTTFHLALVALDPFTYESSWLIDTAARVLETFRGADCRIAFLVTADQDQARAFLGPWADQFLTFADPGRSAARALGITAMPAFVHVNQALQVAGKAEGWDPPAWQAVAEGLARVMSWSYPQIPSVGDPTPYAGTPV